MELYFDLEEIKNAGGAVYSKYGAPKNSKDLKLPEELRKALGDDTWIRETGPETVALENGDYSVFEEQLIGEYKGNNCLRILRMCNLVGKDSTAYANGLRKLWPYNMVNMGQLEAAKAKAQEKEKPKYAIDVRFSRDIDRGAYYRDTVSARMADTPEKNCDKEKILQILRRNSREAIYLSPWRQVSYERSWNQIWDSFESYSNELKSRIIEMYLDISALDEVSPRNRYVIYHWAARELWKLPYVNDKVKACRCYTKLAENNKDDRTIYYNHLSWLRDNTGEDSFLVLKRLESYDVPEVPYYLGIKYLEGYGCEKDYQEAKRCFVKGKEQGPDDLKEQCAGMVSYATRKGDSYELFKIAMKKLETERFEEGISQLKRLADADRLEDAQWELAKLYENGYRMKKDEELAFKYYEKAAESGHEKAIRKMIQVYEEQQLGLNRKGWQERDTYPKQLEKWKGRLKYPSRKNYKIM